MRLLALSLIALIAAIAAIVGISHKPLEMQMDAHNSGAWLNYAAVTAVPTKPDLVCMYVYVPGEVAGAPKRIVRT